MNIYNFDVNFTTGRIYAPDFILVVNDHNSTLFKFTFDQTGRYVFKLLYPDGTIYVQDITDNQLKLTKGVLNQEGNYKFEISLYGDDNRLTTARIKEFPVRLELVSTDEPVQADDRLPILDNLIEETNKVVEAAKNGDLDGATFTPSVSDNGDLSWTNDKGKENPPTVNIAGPPGAPGAVKMQVVDTLPDVGETDTIYLLKKDTPGEQNLYDEYVYTETTGWEHIGDTSVDLTDYYTKEETDEKLDGKQDTLTAGDNITIENNVISAEVETGINNTYPVYSFYVLSTARMLPGGYQNITANSELELTTISNIINDAYSKNSNKFVIYIGTSNTEQHYMALVPFIVYINYKDKPTRITGEGYHIFSDLNTSVYGQNFIKCIRGSLIVTGEWNNDKFIASSMKLESSVSGNQELCLIKSVLLKTNEGVYTPTKDYHPATKKYVDDNKVTKSGMLKYLEEENVYILTIDNNVNPNAAKIVQSPAGTTDAELCGCFAEILSKVIPKKSGTLILNVINIGSNNNMSNCAIFQWYYVSNKFYTMGVDYYGCRISYLNITFNTNTDGTYNVTRVVLEYDQIKSSYTPSSDTHVTNKKYVDGKYKSYTGYDAKKTQVLKNVNGVLTWVTEE